MDFLNKEEKGLLALYLKRVTFNAVYEFADCDTHENMKSQTYDILDVLNKVQSALAAEGFAPR
jgi:hypothetical protein